MARILAASITGRIEDQKFIDIFKKKIRWNEGKATNTGENYIY